MIISPGRNYIFVHIPKTGGTSMALALEDRAHRDDILLGDTPKAMKRKGRVKGAVSAGRLWKHSTLRDIVGLVPEDQIEAAFVFTLVRNPWDRVLSYYTWLQAQSFDHPAVKLSKALDFDGFLAHDHTQRSLKASPYGSYVRLPSEIEHCDLFVRLEHLDEELPRLEQALSLKLGEFPHVNRSERRDTYRDAYSARGRHIVSQVAEEDISRFGYSF